MALYAPVHPQREPNDGLLCDELQEASSRKYMRICVPQAIQFASLESSFHVGIWKDSGSLHMTHTKALVFSYLGILDQIRAFLPSEELEAKLDGLFFRPISSIIASRRREDTRKNRRTEDVAVEPGESEHPPVV
uniref:Uncharacterized protein n=1 Tax=Octactis speculum TaxID=3111310 RepID=A0A7S2C019_9STRA|mmetsp:Transcript_29775/g.40381  ORF Transcript_29775/g.40381 Transcript_29775/m.40381 type:complete len:134 (+) Transcript_29775:242-643(+)